jgi:tripeptide aminopeptidase
MKDKALENFLRYVSINTQSDETSDTSPSTSIQFDLAHILVDELKALGLQDVGVDEHCYVMASLPANCDRDAPKIGLLAHMDTSPEVSGEHVTPRIIETYTGGDIVLNEADNIVINGEDDTLKACVGDTLVTSDGTTLLGADDKAGIAAIMTLLGILNEQPDIPHGELKIAFTPDEEVGRGVDHFDVAKFGADYAYTVDGSIAGELNMETFSADAATIEVQGRNIHPGTAKNVMVNAIRVMGHIVSRLPPHMTPETTEGYEPFIHPMAMTGSVDRATLKLILRDFKTAGLDTQREILEHIITEVQALYPRARITLEITKTYRNMRDELEKNAHVTDALFAAANKAGANPTWKPIRGGTDGSRLTEMGLPTPNLFGGGANFHSKTEWLSVDSLVKSIGTLLNLVRIDDSV